MSINASVLDTAMNAQSESNLCYKTAKVMTHCEPDNGQTPDEVYSKEKIYQRMPLITA